MLNAGHQRNRPAVRMVGNGPDMKPGKFPTFAMAALAGLGDLPDTIMDRSVVVRMRALEEAPWAEKVPRPGPAAGHLPHLRGPRRASGRGRKRCPLDGSWRRADVCGPAGGQGSGTGAYLRGSVG